MTVVIRGGSPILRRRLRQGDADGVGEGVGVGVPHPFQQLLGADHPPAGGHEDFEHGELLVGEGERPAGSLGDAAVGVEGRDRPAVSTGGDGRRGPPAQGPDAGDQLGEGERLGQVVVGPDGQAVDAVLDCARTR